MSARDGLLALKRQSEDGDKVMSKTLTVTFGRNIGDVPMDLDRWAEFSWKARETVRDFTSELWADGVSRSQWLGTPEESRVLYGPVKPTVNDLNLRQLRARLANLATQYGQEAIGLSVGESELVESYGQAETREAEVFA